MGTHSTYGHTHITHCHQSPRGPSVKGAVCGLEEDWSIDIQEFHSPLSWYQRSVHPTSFSRLRSPHALHLLTFLSPTHFQQLSPTALENLRTSLVVQVSSRQCLTTACQHHTALLLLTDVGATSAANNITASTRSDLTTAAVQWVGSTLL